METPIRQFDFFRINHGKEKVDVSPEKLRQWNLRTGGPSIYRMNEDDMTWMRFSEVEKYIQENSKEAKAA